MYRMYKHILLKPYLKITVWSLTLLASAIIFPYNPLTYTTVYLSTGTVSNTLISDYAKRVHSRGVSP
jgi:hypothetical protein